MARYRVSYIGKHDEDIVVADTFKDVPDPLTGGSQWIDFVRFEDDGHADLLQQRVLRVRADHVLRVALLDEEPALAGVKEEL